MWNNDQWGDSSEMYDSEMNGRRFQNNFGQRNTGPPSLLGGRTGTSISSSNQINSNLFADYQFRNNTSPYRSMGSFNSFSSGRVNRNNLVDYMKTKRILQKRALNSAGNSGVMLNSTMINSSNIRRRRKLKPKQQQETKAADKTANTTTSEKVVKLERNAPPEFRLAIAWNNEAKAILNPEQSRLVVQSLEQKIDELSVAEDGHVPKFYTAGLSAGVIKIVCVDQQSVDWLKTSIESLTHLWENAKFDILLQSDLNALLHTYVILTKNEDTINIASFLKRLEKQNSPLKTDKWRLHRESITSEGKHILAFLIDDESNNFLKERDWRLYLGLRQFKFNSGKQPPPPQSQIQKTTV